MSNYTSNCGESQGPRVKMSDFLGKGAENAVTMRQLADWTGLPSRQLRRRIQAERLKGTPILSTCRGGCLGYFLPTGKSEIENWVASMRHRAGEINRVAAVVQLSSLDFSGEGSPDGQ